jgi:hypothetical protein
MQSTIIFPNELNMALPWRVRSRQAPKFFYTRGELRHSGAGFTWLQISMRTHKVTDNGPKALIHSVTQCNKSREISNSGQIHRTKEGDKKIVPPFVHALDFASLRPYRIKYTVRTGKQRNSRGANAGLA